MRKIPTLFKRDPDNRSRLLREVTPGCEWVTEGLGVPTLKIDGTCCLIKEGVLWKRREVKKGKPIPFVFRQEAHDLISGKRFGWVPVTPEDTWHQEAWEMGGHFKPDGTYELVGPRVQGNPENYDRHVLLRHGEQELDQVPTGFDELAEWLRGRDMEGIVWHHEDGRKAKIKQKDFGFTRGEA